MLRENQYNKEFSLKKIVKDEISDGNDNDNINDDNENNNNENKDDWNELARHDIFNGRKRRFGNREEEKKLKNTEPRK